MAKPRVRCNLCERDLTPHCPSPHNHTCTWMRCTNQACTAELYDLARGILRHTDGRQESWDEQPTTDQPPTVTIVGEAGPEAVLPPTDDQDDGRPPAPDA